ncbi:MAG: GNAT family N-acetyltransferase [Alphaproteobacteria bacterium]|nr:GNAT family N-acetyltransferase [Alphaproteobacteria bacterium]
MSTGETTDQNRKDLAAGALEVRLAETAAEVDAAQALRYRVFYDEMGAAPTQAMQLKQRDFDAFDDYCDHLLVIDHAAAPGGKVVGTYRLIRREAAAKQGSFYSSSEYDITPLVNYPGEVLELGRSCIDAEHRIGTVMQTLWRGLAGYIVEHDITLMFGCASLPGIDPEAHALPLSYLYYHHLAPPALRAKALPERYIDMKRLPREAFDPAVALNSMKLDPRSGGNSLPPLIKGYLRVGGYVGDGAVIDEQFNTTDVCIIVKTDLITSRYMRHYERPNS